MRLKELSKRQRMCPPKINFKEYSGNSKLFLRERTGVRLQLFEDTETEKCLFQKKSCPTGNKILKIHL